MYIKLQRLLNFNILSDLDNILYKTHYNE